MSVFAALSPVRPQARTRDLDLIQLIDLDPKVRSIFFFCSIALFTQFFFAEQSHFRGAAH
jgi:hypothetical protein